MTRNLATAAVWTVAIGALAGVAGVGLCALAAGAAADVVVNVAGRTGKP